MLRKSSLQQDNDLLRALLHRTVVLLGNIPATGNGVVSQAVWQAYVKACEEMKKKVKAILNEKQFQEVEVVGHPSYTVSITAFRHDGRLYVICTSDIVHLRIVQRVIDATNGYTGEMGNYETMLFIDDTSLVYPFGDLPGHPGLGVFQRYDTEDQARDGHQAFVTRVKAVLMKRETTVTQVEKVG